MASYIVKEYEKTSLDSREWTSRDVYQGYNLRQVLEGVRLKYLPTAPGWKIQVEARNNNRSVWRTPAKSLLPGRERILVHNFKRELRIVRVS